MAHGQLKVCRPLPQVDDGDNEITKDEFVEVVAKLKEEAEKQKKRLVICVRQAA